MMGSFISHNSWLKMLDTCAAKIVVPFRGTVLSLNDAYSIHQHTVHIWISFMVASMVSMASSNVVCSTRLTCILSVVGFHSLDLEWLQYPFED